MADIDVNASVERLRLRMANSAIYDLTVTITIYDLENVLKALADRTSSLVDAEEDFDRMEIRAEVAEARVAELEHAREVNTADLREAYSERNAARAKLARIAEACHHATHHPGDSFDEYLSGRSDMAYEVEAILNEGSES